MQRRSIWLKLLLKILKSSTSRLSPYSIQFLFRHSKQVGQSVQNIDQDGLETHQETKIYEPVQPVKNSSHGVTLIPLNSSTFDLDIIQRLNHGTTVIHYDMDSGRSVLCRLVLDFSCSAVSWHRIYYNGKDARDKDVSNSTRGTVQNISDASKSGGTSCRPPGAASFSLDEGFIQTSYIKATEIVDSYDLDLEAIYRRHSSEEMSVPVFCFRINFGCVLNENEFLYFVCFMHLTYPFNLFV